jgi:hypothetical protein
MTGSVTFETASMKTESEQRALVDLFVHEPDEQDVYKNLYCLNIFLINSVVLNHEYFNDPQNQIRPACLQALWFD